MTVVPPGRRNTFEGRVLRELARIEGRKTHPRIGSSVLGSCGRDCALLDTREDMARRNRLSAVGRAYGCLRRNTGRSPMRAAMTRMRRFRPFAGQGSFGS